MTRTPCCIPFCRRGTTKFPDSPEIMCGKHYRLAPKSLRRRRTKILRALARERDPRRAQRLFDLQQRLWERAKATVTNIAMGIG